MAAELAVLAMLKNDTIIQSYCGASPVRVYPFHVPQTRTLPAIVVRSQNTEPNHTKDGPSQLDFERVQVLMYTNEFDTTTFALEERVRALLDRPTPGFVNGVDLESSSFEDRDTFKEQLIDNEVYAIEHIYKCMVKR